VVPEFIETALGGEYKWCIPPPGIVFIIGGAWEKVACFAMFGLINPGTAPSPVTFGA
jgi:hypothetical protein